MESNKFKFAVARGRGAHLRHGRANDYSYSLKVNSLRPRKGKVLMKSKGSLLKSSLLLRAANVLFYSGL